MWKRAKGEGDCDGLNLDYGSGIQKLYTEYSRGNLLDSYHSEAGKRAMIDVMLWGSAVRDEYEPLSYRVPVRERYGSTLLPATREQHDQNCTQSH